MDDNLRSEDDWPKRPDGVDPDVKSPAPFDVMDYFPPERRAEIARKLKAMG